MEAVKGTNTVRTLRVTVGMLASLLCLFPLAIMERSGSARATTAPTTAIRAEDFLNSIGVNSAIDRRGEDLAHTIQCTKYLGLRWFRSGPEGDPAMADLLELHKQTGAKFSWGLLSGGSDVSNLLKTSQPLAAAGAILAFEGPNEPNNWGITYNGQAGGKGLSWVPVANLQHALYQAVKSDSTLKKYPVWSISEGGAETDNVGLQFLTIPKDAKCVMPDGTTYADYANVHNYIYHPNAPGLEDNKTWKAAEPTSACKVDGLYGEYGVTWAKHYPGYSGDALLNLPRVTTETGTTIGGPVTEEIHALNLMSLYLDQFKRGWSHTAVYLLRDRVDEGGNQQFGFYKPDYTPRKAAVYLHNLTTILADNGAIQTSGKRVFSPGKLSCSIPNKPETAHDLLLQKSSGAFEWVVWNERVSGSDTITIELGGIYSVVTVYDPTTGTLPIKTFRNVSSVPLSLSDHAVILEFNPHL